jgi:hypothetical protein
MKLNQHKENHLTPLPDKAVKGEGVISCDAMATKSDELTFISRQNSFDS